MTDIAQDPARARSAHQELIVDQFSRQAELFAQSPSLHNEEALRLLVETAGTQAGDTTLDVACGPGSVVLAFARVARRSFGIDATAAMLEEAKKLTTGR